MIKILELFGGIGACSSALTRLGIEYEISDYVEIDKYAVKSFNAIHNTNFEPQDICKWDKDIKVDLIMHGSPCVTADSLILTKQGYKPIIDIMIGDEVLTKSNTWQKVAKKFDNGIHQTCYVDGMGFENIHCTLNHKFYVREMYRKGHKNIRCFKEPVFKEAKDLTKKDYFGVPVIQEEKTFYTDECDFWYMLGMYLGDGWLSKTTNDIIIACNDTKLEKLKTRLNQEKWKYTYYKEKACYKFRFSNKNVYQFIKKYIGTGSDNKHIPYEILCLPKKQLQSFYDGYLDSDGCVVENYHQFSSINRGMLYSVSLIINKLYNRPTCFYKIKVAKTKIIEGREVNQKEWYQLRFKPTTNKQDKAFYEDGYIWYPFNKLTIAKKENVYNMEVEEDHSYIIQGCISKNCQDFSLAGKQAGGDKDSGTRSSLMYETIRIVEKLKPKYVIWENVKNLLSKKHRHNFDAYLEAMKQLGYTNYYQVLNAKDYGIPQNRERVFTVSILGDRNFEFPEGNINDNKIIEHNPKGKHQQDLIQDEDGLCRCIPAGTHGSTPHLLKTVVRSYEFPPKQELKLKLKDMLEDEVDDKYYLSDEWLKKIKYEYENNTICETRYDEGIRTFKDNICGSLRTIDAGGNKCVIQVKEATKQGYKEAHEGDGVNISSRMKYQRGNVQKESIQTLTTQCDRGVVVNDNNIYNLFFTIFGLCCTIDTKEKDKYERSRELLQILWKEVGKKEIWQQIRRFIGVQEKKILQSNLYENELYEDRKSQSKISTSTPNSSEYNEIITDREKMFNMWKNWKTRYTPQRWELSEQQFRQFNLFMQELSYETTQGETSMQGMWQTNERFRILQQTLFKIQEIWRSNENKISNGLRIRKLTPREVWRLMGFDDEDFEKAAFKKETSYIEGGLKCNAKLKIVNEKQRHLDMETYALCTTNDMLDMETPIRTKRKKSIENENNEKMQNVNIAIEMLNEVEQKECVTNIIKCGENTTILYTLMEELDQHHMAIIELGKRGKANIEKYMKITLEENLNPMKLYTISILIEQIIKSKIYTCITQKANIQGNIAIIEDCVKNLKMMKLSNLKMEYITRLNSDTMLYKQAGNSIVVNVLEAIFKELIK